ncbi:MAG: hypothetical protein H0W99_08435 [Acidobacteria bacterium]|nr:hypothetical protein [Acidobacteriota bacterium]
MEKIDRLGWAAGIVIVSYGVRAGIRANDPKVLDRAMQCLPHGWKQSSSSSVVERLYSLIVRDDDRKSKVRRFNLLYGNIERLARATDAEQVFEIFESNLRLHVAEAAPRRVFVHAGVVGWRERAILIPGRSFSGKTTLTSELVRAGATYYSDEYAVLDERGHVHPFLKPLAIREEGSARQKNMDVEALGGTSGAKPLRVGLVIASEYKSGARWQPRRLSAGQGALALLANTVSARRQPEAALSTLQQIVTYAPVLSGKRGEAKKMAASLLEMLD